MDMGDTHCTSMYIWVLCMTAYVCVTCVGVGGVGVSSHRSLSPNSTLTLLTTATLENTITSVLETPLLLRADTCQHV